MRIVFLVNDATGIKPSQTTAMLISAAVTQGHDVGIVGVGDLSCQSDGEPWAQIRWVAPAQRVLGNSQDLQGLMEAIAKTVTHPTLLTQTDCLFIRTNPARDLNRAALYSTALNLARRCQDKGVHVINQPDGLIRAATKLYLLELPEFTRPPTLVSQNRSEILTFIGSLSGPAVLKPLQGTRGNDVFLVSSENDQNLNQIIDVILRQGLVMAQGCIPGAEAGDTRVVVLNGEVLEVNGKCAAIQRVPAKGDFRSNIHAGGHAEPGVVTDAMQRVVTAIGPKLVKDGLFLVGLDFIGSQLVELNVFSTGGLHDAERFTGEAFAKVTIDALVLGNSQVDTLEN